MRGNVNFQVQQLYKTVESIGESKHEAKAEARENGAVGAAEIAKEIGIYSYSTADAYRDVWRAVGEFAKAEYGIKDMERITGEVAVAYLNSKIEEGVARATFGQYAAAVEKMETALNRFASQNETGNTYKFGLDDVRQVAALELGERNHEARAYADPAKLCSNIEDKQHSLAAQIQHESGGRVKEVSQIKESQLKGLQADRITGELKGKIEVDGKGGKVRELQVSPAAYATLKAAIAANGGVFKIADYKAYVAALEKSAGKTGQDYNGSHGLRWNFAQERMQELQGHGLTYEQALQQVSHEMGHERSDITEHYLK